MDIWKFCEEFEKLILGKDQYGKHGTNNDFVETFEILTTEWIGEEHTLDDTITFMSA